MFSPFSLRPHFEGFRALGQFDVPVVFLRMMIWSHSIILTVDPALSHNFNWGWQTEFGGFPGKCLLEREVRAAHAHAYFYTARPKLHKCLLRRLFAMTLGGSVRRLSGTTLFLQFTSFLFYACK